MTAAAHAGHAPARRLPDSRHPAVLAVLLDWLHDTLPAPKAARWQTERQSGFATTRRSSDWQDCHGGCGGKGRNRWGICPTCLGAGGWYTDPMDQKRRDLKSDTDARPASPERRTVKLSTDTDAELAVTRDGLPPCLQQMVQALDMLRTRNRYHRSVLQRVHIIRLDRPHTLRPAEHAVYVAALDHLGSLLPAGFRAPRPCREKAARQAPPRKPRRAA